MASAQSEKPYIQGRNECADAAYVYRAIQAEEDIALASYYIQLGAWEKRRERTRGSKPRKPPRTSIRAFASRTKWSEAAIRKHLKSIRATGLPELSDRPKGRPRYLEPWEDEALVRYATQLPLRDLPTLRTGLVAAANTMRALRDKPPVGKHFMRRWMDRHPELRATLGLGGETGPPSPPVPLVFTGQRLAPDPLLAPASTETPSWESS